MTETGAPNAPAASYGTVLRMLITAAIPVVLSIAAVVWIFAYIDEERERSLQVWQVRLGIVAASRVAAVESWLADQTEVVADVAENPGLRLFLGQRALAGGDLSDIVGGAGQLEINRNLLDGVAARTGFDAPPLGPPVAANVEREGIAGLLVVEPDGDLIVASSTAQRLHERFRDAVASASLDDGAIAAGPLMGADDEPAMAFLAPIFAAQGEQTAEDHVGWVVGVKPVADELLPLLEQPGTVEQTAEAVLIRRDDGVIQYLSPLRDGTPSLGLQLAADTAHLASAFVLEAPGGFAARRNYAGEDVLVTGRAVSGAAGWFLMYMVEREEALGPTEERLRSVMAILLLAIIVVLSALIGVWYYGTSRRARQSAALYRATAERLDRQERFLRLVTDSQPSSIYILDRQSEIRFVNRQFAEVVGGRSDDLVNKRLDAVIGPAPARRAQRLAEDARDEGRTLADVERRDEGETLHVSRSRFVPLPAEAEPNGGVLVVEEDISDLIAARERQERTLDHIVRALVAVVDRRDPFSADHSQRVSRLAGLIAREMDLEPMLVGTAETAGLLMNLGKILVPAAVLTRSGELTAAEIRQIRDSILTSADLIREIEFDGPVTETLRQIQEAVDGSGYPAGLKDGEILVTARVLAVANAFVAMASPRAHRDRLSVDQAVAALLDRIDGQFDRGVVAALINYLDNKGGRRAYEPSPERDEAGEG